MKTWAPEEIRLLRKRLGLIQESFGERIGVTRNYVYYLERGERLPSKTLMLLLDYIDNELREKENAKGKEVKKHGKGNL
jgi:transcriptional regulator with XRE-family HTH domain